MPDGSPGVPVSLSLPAEMLEKLDRIAAVMGESRSAVLVRALEFYLADEGQEMIDIQEGIDELDRGEFVTYEEMLADVDAAIARIEAKRAAE